MAAIFPTLNGLDWGLTKTPEWNTLVVKSASGREVRSALQSQPIWHFVLSYAYLKDGVGGINDLKTLMGFYLQRQGSFDYFLFQDFYDNTVTDQFIATGNGSTKSFQLYRTLGGFSEIIRDVASLTVKINGSTTSAYSIDGNGVVTFTNAPANGATITASFNFYFRVRFEDDQFEFTSILDQLWEAKSVKFVTVR